MNADISIYEKAIILLRAGQVIALPTETVYGIAACAHIDSAVLDIFKIKHRAANHPISLCVFHVEQAEDMCDVSPLARRLMAEFWPGPLTIVLPKKPTAKISPHLSNLPTIGLRCPDAQWRIDFARLGFTQPLALTSANTSGQPSPTCVSDIEPSITEALPLTIDGGPCKSAMDSTVVSVKNERVRILRYGAMRPESFAAYPVSWEQS